MDSFIYSLYIYWAATTCQALFWALGTHGQQKQALSLLSWNLGFNGRRLAFVSKAQDLGFIRAWAVAFSEVSTTCLQSSGIGRDPCRVYELFLYVKLIKVSVVSSLQNFVCNIDSPDTRNDKLALLDNFSHTMICEFSDFSKYNSFLAMTAAFYQVSNIKLSLTRCLYPPYEYPHIHRGFCFFISYDWSNVPFMSPPTRLQGKKNWIFPQGMVSQSLLV